MTDRLDITLTINGEAFSVAVEARRTLAELKALDGASEGWSDSAEFEAGVLALAGLDDDAMSAYRRGLARYPDRIEVYLLLADLMVKRGQRERAVGMFQSLAETADKDDLFTVAVDGLLNVDAPHPVLDQRVDRAQAHEKEGDDAHGPLGCRGGRRHPTIRRAYPMRRRC